MRKIPTIFERDWNGDRSRVLDEHAPGCEWVFRGEGAATRKYDGTCCLIRDGRFYRRHEVRPGKTVPDGFELVETDEQTGKQIGWVLVGDGPEDRWHREGLENGLGIEAYSDGTYELLGPKVNGNPEHLVKHRLYKHSEADVLDCPRDYEGLRDWLPGRDIEGVVWHHLDGRMAKIKARDFGIRRAGKPVG